jgi:hypothetical protein
MGGEESTPVTLRKEERGWAEAHAGALVSPGSPLLDIYGFAID